jgi:hypothetical protein
MEFFEDRPVLENSDEKTTRVKFVINTEPLHSSTRSKLDLLSAWNTEHWLERAGVSKDDDYQHTIKQLTHCQYRDHVPFWSSSCGSVPVLATVGTKRSTGPAWRCNEV